MPLTSLPIRDCESESLWNPHRLVSLWEIVIEHQCYLVAEVIARIIFNRDFAADRRDLLKSQGAEDTIDAQSFIDAVLEVVGPQMDSLADKYGLVGSRRVARGIKLRIERGIETTYTLVAHDLYELYNTIYLELHDRMFIYISPECVPYFELVPKNWTVK